MAVFPVQGPADARAKVLNAQVVGLGDVTQHAVHRLGLVVALLALHHVLGVHAALGQVDVTCGVVSARYTGWG